MLIGRMFGGWTALFLATTILTSVTGFPIPPFGFDPPRAIGTLSLILLAVAVGALYVFHLRGAWRWLYAGAAIVALYFNVAVAIIQSFEKLPFLPRLSPTLADPPFAFVLTQIVVLVIFVVLDILALAKFHPKTKAV
jgi:hypothetical protein